MLLIAPSRVISCFINWMPPLCLILSNQVCALVVPCMTRCSLMGMTKCHFYLTRQALSIDTRMSWWVKFYFISMLIKSRIASWTNLLSWGKKIKVFRRYLDVRMLSNGDAVQDTTGNLDQTNLVGASGMASGVPNYSTFEVLRKFLISFPWRHH